MMNRKIFNFKRIGRFYCREYGWTGECRLFRKVQTVYSMQNKAAWQCISEISFICKHYILVTLQIHFKSVS